MRVLPGDTVGEHVGLCNAGDICAAREQGCDCGCGVCGRCFGEIAGYSPAHCESDDLDRSFTATVL